MISIIRVLSAGGSDNCATDTLLSGLCEWPDLHFGNLKNCINIKWASVATFIKDYFTVITAQLLSE